MAFRFFVPAIFRTSIPFSHRNNGIPRDFPSGRRPLSAACFLPPRLEIHLLKKCRLSERRPASHSPQYFRRVPHERHRFRNWCAGRIIHGHPEIQPVSGIDRPQLHLLLQVPVIVVHTVCRQIVILRPGPLQSHVQSARMGAGTELIDFDIVKGLQPGIRYAQERT